MNTYALWHQAKSEYAYAYDKNTLHILLRTAKNDIDTVTLIYGDPFDWSHDNHQKLWRNHSLTMTKRYQSNQFDYYFIEIKPKDLRNKYAFLLEKDNQTYFYGSRLVQLLDDDIKYDLTEYFNYPYINHEDLHDTPKWVEDTIWYQIFLDRYHAHHKNSNLKWGSLPVKNHELYGGDLLGVIDQLDDLKALGITGIYFTPIFKSPSAHKYDTTDYFTIDPQFGSNDDFKQLVKEAHKRHIKVMLDGVFNHAGFFHPYFQDVIKHGEKSIYKDCFYIGQFPVVNFELDQNQHPIKHSIRTLNYKTFAYTSYMPKWNTSNPLSKEHLLSVITYWIKEYDIDGWRLDVSNEISHDFLRDIKKVSREAKKDTFILGENWDSSIAWLKGDQLDSVMNYDLSYPLWKYLEHKIDLNTFTSQISQYLAQTPKNVIKNMFNLIGSHDTIRIKTRLNDDIRRVKLAFAFMFLSSGAPNIYYGDEIGLSGEMDPDNRRCYPLNAVHQDLDLKAFIKQFIHLRKTHESFKTSDYHFIDSNILAFTKTSKDEDILVLMNNGEKTTLNLDQTYTGCYENLLTSKTIYIHDKMDIDTYALFILKKEVTKHESNH